ncbi:hypothetical protein BKA81DRAFT_417346 [Phyllosticta paracitricarpa]|uniref:Uncharacterized protein n=1 Tax=Phyllosticta citricarpa TaxID=55181 RepID=A0ABR1M2E9_9PEZI
MPTEGASVRRGTNDALVCRARQASISSAASVAGASHKSPWDAADAMDATENGQEGQVFSAVSTSSMAEQSFRLVDSLVWSRVAITQVPVSPDGQEWRRTSWNCNESIPCHIQLDSDKLVFVAMFGSVQGKPLAECGDPTINKSSRHAWHPTDVGHCICTTSRSVMLFVNARTSRQQVPTCARTVAAGPGPSGMGFSFKSRPSAAGGASTTGRSGGRQKQLVSFAMFDPITQCLKPLIRRRSWATMTALPACVSPGSADDVGN